MAATEKKTVAKKYELMPTKGQLPEIKGLTLRWVNLMIRGRNGWDIWTPVVKGTEIGNSCEKFFEDAHVFRAFVAGAEDSEYLFNGASTVLAYALEKDALAHRKAMNDRADDQLRSVMQDKDVTGKLRHVSITSDPTQ